MLDSTFSSCFRSFSAFCSRARLLSWLESPFWALAAAFLASILLLVGNLERRSAIHAAISDEDLGLEMISQHGLERLGGDKTYLGASAPYMSLRRCSSFSSSSSDSSPGVKPRVLVLRFFFLPVDAASGF